MNSSYVMADDKVPYGYGYARHFTFYGEFNRNSNWIGIFEAVCISFLALVAIFANLLVIVIIAANKTMRTVHNLLLANLAACGVASVIGFPIIAVTRICETWIFGRVGCGFSFYSQSHSALASVWTMAFISFDKHRSITTTGAHALCVKTGWIFIAVTHVIGLISGLPLGIFYLVLEANVGSEPVHICTLVWPKWVIKVSMIYVMTIGILMIGTPSAFISYHYIKIFQVLQMTKRAVVKHIRVHPADNGSVLRQNQTMKSRDKRDLKVTSLLVLLVTVYGMSYLPLFVVCSVQLYDTLKNTALMKSHFLLLAICIIYANSCTNPLIYGLLNGRIRDGFKKLKTICCHKKEFRSTSQTDIEFR